MRESPPRGPDLPDGPARAGRLHAGALWRGGRWIVCGVVLFTVLPYAVFAARAALVVNFSADPPRRILSGLYPSEHTPEGLTFAWTRETFGLTLPRLDRRLSWRLTLRVAASRPDGSSPTLITSVDGVTTSTVDLPAGGFADHVVTVPARGDRPRATAVSFRVTPTFTPGGDPRARGVQIDRIALAPVDGWPVLPAQWLEPVAWGSAAGALAATAAVSAAVGAIWLALTALVVALITTTGLAPYAGSAGWSALAVAAGSTLVCAAVLPRTRAGAAAAMLMTFTVAAVHSLVLLHPDMPIGDALFHAHRFQEVRGGRYFFTSIAPGDYRFPYPIGLYLFASPLARFTQSALENANLLRIVVVFVNAAAAALLYRVASRWRAGDEIAGGAAVASFHLVPLTFGVIGTGNLTNAFAQSMAIVSLVLAAAIGAGERRAALLSLLLVAATSTAFLSHTSTFAVLAAQLAAGGVALAVGGQKSRGGWILAAAVAAVIASVIVYYGHFGDVYREAWGRIAAETGRATEAAGGRTPYARLVEAPQWLIRYYGWPMLLLAALGAGVAFSRRARLAYPISVLLLGWLGAAVVFLAIGIVTPVDLRHFYAAAPGLALLSALGCSWLWQRGAWTAAAAVVLGGWAIWVAWHEAAGRFLAGW